MASYVYRNGASITRGSQPRTGFIGYNSPEDIKLITAIRETNPAKSLYIIDCRPYINVIGNCITGGGVETAAYEMCKVEFLNIPNMVDVSHSFARMRDAFYLEAKGVSSMAIATNGLEWNRILQLILAGVKKVVTLIAVHNTSTFIHCSDAWDRTAQLCSLAQVCLDPRFRTMEGFGVLVEKEWMRMGHKFQDRTDPDADKKESSPVFLQFLDCVFQLMAQYPSAFEFTEDFLIDLYDEAVCSRYGNFCCNCDKERRDLNLSEKTHSVWSHLLADRHHYANPLYVAPSTRHSCSSLSLSSSQSSLSGSGLSQAKAKTKARDSDRACEPVLDEIFEVSSTGKKVGPQMPRNPNVLFPRVESYNIVFWVGFYGRYIEGSSSVSRPIAEDGRLAAIDKIKELEAQVRELKEKLGASDSDSGSGSGSDK